MLIKPWNDSTVLVRVHNMHDEENKTITLFATDVSPLLTTFYGNIIRFSSVEEMSLGGNMKYEEFIARKWNWESVVNLKQENNIFRKVFGEKITLRPLEIRTFLFTGLRVEE